MRFGLFPAVVLMLLVSSPALAQGHVFGTVKDGDGHPIKGATISAENPSVSPSSATATSDAKGQFSFLGLRSGLWTFTVQAPGYEGVVTQFVTKTIGSNGPVQAVLLKRPEAPAGPLTSVDVPALQRRLDDSAALEASGKLDEAIKEYRAIAADVPTLTMVHLALGMLYERSNDPISAAVEYNAVLQTDPDNAKARAGLDRVAPK
jgi:hypothetical protein